LAKQNATAAGDGPQSPAAVVLLLQHGQVHEKAYTSREGGSGKKRSVKNAIKLLCGSRCYVTLAEMVECNILAAVLLVPINCMEVAVIPVCSEQVVRTKWVVKCAVIDQTGFFPMSICLSQAFFPLSKVKIWSKKSVKSSPGQT
jgi:hypothetical protein